MQQYVDGEDLEAPPALAPGGAQIPGDAKRYKWEVPSSDKYIWSSSKGHGHMPVNFATKGLGDTAPPSAPKDIQKGVKKIREAKAWEKADHIDIKTIHQYLPQKTVEEKLEIKVENVFDGDDWQEMVANKLFVAVFSVIGDYLCCCFSWRCCSCLFEWRNRFFGSCCGEIVDDDDEVGEVETTKDGGVY